MRRLGTAIVVATLLGAASACVGPPAGGRGQTHSAPAWCPIPVEAPVIDGFRPPEEPWLPGNRGLSFGTHPGQPVRALAAGVVSFAGMIAHSRYVSIRIDDKRKATYSYLSLITVRAGDQVSTGEVIGRTGTAPFQLGLRDGATYLDPTPLVRGVCGTPHAVLVPVPRTRTRPSTH